MPANARAIIFANGVLNAEDISHLDIAPDDLVIAADGGLHNCRKAGLLPSVVIGDLDSIKPEEAAALDAVGVQLIQYPRRKDFTDLELALIYAQEQGAREALILAALGNRWDQTLANLLLPGAAALASLRISLLDGPQEILFIRSGEQRQVRGRAGDTLSLIPLGGDAQGITTQGLEYPLNGETLYSGSTRGVSNELTSEAAAIFVERGVLLCVVIHGPLENL